MPRKVKRASSTSSKTSSRVNVMVGRFGSEPTSVSVKANGTVGDVLKRADISLGEGERAWLNGGHANLTDKVRKGDIVSVVAPKEAGLR